MPRILVIGCEPGQTDGFPPGQAAATAPLPIDPGTEIVRRPTRLVAPPPGSAPAALLLDFAVYETGLGAEAEGFDGVYVHHVLDPGVAALRSVLSVPVLGAGRAAMLYALTLGSRFAVLAPDSGTAARLKKAVHDQGLDPACACVRALEKGKPRGEAALEAARLSLAADGAEVIVLGSTGMAAVAYGLSGALDAPVVDPGPLGLTLLESFLALGLRHSRRAHPEPLARKDALVRTLVDAASARAGRDVESI
jgi:Asp/Glu/hydantoin racemase